jgi:uncharacterized RDD family membrane protein YckC
MAGIGASAYVLAPCPSCGLDWGTEKLACQNCGQVEDLPVGVRLSSPAKRFAGHMLELGLIIVTAGVGWIVWSFVVYARAQTPAKQLLNMRVMRVDTRERAGWLRMFAREWLAKPALGILGGLTAGIAYFWMVWDKRNQELWDKVVDTIVVDDPERKLAPPRLPPDWDATS